jgi:hypothetical protein
MSYGIYSPAQQADADEFVRISVADPSLAPGLAASEGTVAVSVGGTPDLWLKVGPSDTDWEQAAITSINNLGGNFRISNNEIQLRETSPTPGWRTVWLENGALQFGPLETS